MDFTREPILETVITPREGCKLAIRSSKSVGQEEYFVDAVEVVSFGNAFFYRSLEKPKCFLLPILDYEVLEVREARMVLRQASSEKPIKIGKTEEKKEEKKEPKKEEESSQEPKGDRKRDRRRNMRRRRGSSDEVKPDLPMPTDEIAPLDSPLEARESASSIIRSLLTPPPLVSEQINQYRETYKQAFFNTSEEESSETEELIISSDEPEEEKTSDDLWNFSNEI